MSDAATCSAATITCPNGCSPARQKTYIEEATRYDGKVSHTVAVLLISITTLIVALAWRDYADFAIRKAFYNDPNEELTVKFWYALIATIITIILITVVVWYFKQH
jgi:MFS superfamily sulfate permease-like transporter